MYKTRGHLAQRGPLLLCKKIYKRGIGILGKLLYDD